MTKDQLAILETLQLRARETAEVLQSVLEALNITEDFQAGDIVSYYYPQSIMRQEGVIIQPDFRKDTSNPLALLEDKALGVRRIVPLKYCILKDSY